MVRVKTADLKKYKKEYQKKYKSRPEVKKRRNELKRRIFCQCGGKYTNEHPKNHSLTQRHLRYLANTLMKEPLYEFEAPPFETVDMTYFRVFDLDMDLDTDIEIDSDLDLDMDLDTDIEIDSDLDLDMDCL